jgi:hypothetical protein
MTKIVSNFTALHAAISRWAACAQLWLVHLALGREVAAFRPSWRAQGAGIVSFCGEPYWRGSNHYG